MFYDQLLRRGSLGVLSSFVVSRYAYCLGLTLMLMSPKGFVSKNCLFGLVYVH